MLANVKSLNLSAQNTIKSVLDAQSSVDDLEQYGRKDNAIVKGVVQREGEDTTGIVLELFNAMENVSISRNDISISHRLPPKSGKSDIIVRFARREAKIQVYKNKKQLNYIDYDKLSFPTYYEGVFISENLTAKKQRNFIQS